MAGLYTGDKQISGNLEQAKVVSKKKPFSDLDLSLKIHPIRKDIIPLKDDAAVKNAVRNLLISNFYERPFQDDLGANLRGLLFEPVGVITNIELRDNIRFVLEKYEPRITVRSIDITDIFDTNQYRIKVNFAIKQNNQNDSVEIVLRRLR
jgi:phage baseplate assembly protein W|tara:strand:- start:476 stop:925 length:450 start_codon:yes stop_codon:yes gene_type:complete